MASKTTKSRRNPTKSASRAVATANKLSDIKPYWGGDRILSTQGDYIVQCTANFKAVETTGSKSAAAITAGHCGPTGTKWQQAYLSGNTIYSTGDYGTDAKRHFSTAGDQELLTGSSWDYSAWTTYNPGGNSGNVIEYYARSVAKGAHICSDGSYTNYTCGGTVTAVKACANIDEDGTLHNVCGLDTATATHRLVQSGDSGGPVWDQASPAGYAINAGIISAGSDDGKTLLFEDIITAAKDLQFTEPKQA
ncbi:chymotrypsin family serine protease [Jatrophihabitans endophyticus]|uniref:hypothetical protein n=1 Tax=Jatrophihabitans endophyticus TaxID=1206085 RepID=UPI001160ED8B|nr:hypothetical protein [Jatrophihabitans endophyticus]